MGNIARKDYNSESTLDNWIVEAVKGWMGKVKDSTLQGFYC